MSKFKKSHVGVLVEKNSIVDEGDGVISFPNGLVITDNTEQRNGTKYDIPSMDITEYQGQVTADHIDMIDRIIAGVEGITKVENQVVVSKISYLVKENPLARLAYNLALSTKVPTNYSIETFGPQPDEDKVYFNSKLIGLSQIVVGNNRTARINSIVLNSIKEAQEDGLDTEELEENFLQEIEIKQNHSSESLDKKDKVNNKEENMFVTIKNGRGFPVKVTYKNAAGEDTETEVPDGGSVDVSEDQRDEVQGQVDGAKAPKTPEEKKPKEDKEDKKEENANNSLADAIAAAMKPMQDQFKAMEQQLFDSNAKEPEFKRDLNGKVVSSDSDRITNLSYKERHGRQINAAYEWKALGRIESATILNEINEFNLEALKADGKVENSMTIADFGNFVISPELLTEIQGCRNDYTALVSATDWRETLSLQFAWLKRSGDINMQSVEFCDDDANGNLKPISEYTATPQLSNLEELAAVTPVCNAATRFLAADLIGDVARGYRNDYDRKRAQLILARLEQAIESNGNSVVYDTNPTVNALTSWVDTWAEIATCTPNGTFIFSTRTYAEIMRKAVQAGVNGPLSSIFITGQVPTIFGRPFIVVPDDLMPALDTANTVVVQVDGVNVTINHSVYYADLQNFTGRTSGGLQYDLSTEASYEQNGSTKSAFQRNELILRGSFFRGGAILDTDQVAGLLSPGVS